MGKQAQAPKQNSGSSEQKPLMSNVLSWVSDNAGGACKQLLGGTAGPLLVACLCLALVYRDRRRTPVRPMLHRSVSMAALRGGRVALQRILDSQEARIDDAKLADAARHLRDVLDHEPLNIKNMQKAAAKLEMSGKEDEAIEMIQKAWEKANNDGKLHEAHELQMILVEMLIYKGEYQRALDLKCLQDKEISDSRGPLYKSVIYTIIGNKSRAKECYKEYQNIQSRFDWPDYFKEGTPLYGVVHDFSKFEKIVNNLKREIEHAHKD